MRRSAQAGLPTAAAPAADTKRMTDVQGRPHRASTCKKRGPRRCGGARAHNHRPGGSQSGDAQGGRQQPNALAQTAARRGRRADAPATAPGGHAAARAARSPARSPGAPSARGAGSPAPQPRARERGPAPVRAHVPVLQGPRACDARRCACAHALFHSVQPQRASAHLRAGAGSAVPARPSWATRI